MFSCQNFNLSVFDNCLFDKKYLCVPNIINIKTKANVKGESPAAGRL